MAPSASSFSLDLLYPISTPPSSSSSSSSSSPSLYFLPAHPQAFSANTLGALKFRLYCSHHTNTQQINPTKKRRKPRPSFLDQIQDKWSLKTTSLREKFPWQEQEREPIEEEQSQESSGIVMSGSENENSVSFDSRNRVILAPWAQKNKPRKPQFDSEARNSKNSSEEGKRVDGFRGHFVQESKNLVRGLNYDAKFGGSIEIDATPIGLADIKVSSSIGQESKNWDRGLNYDANPEGGIIEIDETATGLAEIKVSSSIVQDSKNLDRELNYDGKLEGGIIEIDATPIGFDESVSLNSIDQEIYSGEDVSDKCNSMRLPYEGKSDGFRERLPWEGESDVKHVEGDNLRESNTIMAEKLIPESELKRLRNVSLRMLERMKVGAAGITQALVNSIHEKWKDDEVVKLKFEGPSAMNMKRSHEILENRTGGLVIWRSGSSVVLFRGMTYKLQCVQSYTKQSQANMKILQSSEDLVNDFTRRVGPNSSTSSWESSTTDPARYLKDLSKKELVDLSELNLLLDELGPRFKDWSGRDPLPVDADLLPSVVQGYKRPFRLLPYGTRRGLRDKEMTFYRRTARTMPPHFALGRNRELQGLAMAMVKLWRRSAIAKIAIKRGVHNTCNERMAEELKRLTGGTLVSRNKDYIVFYRGNDFLPPGVTNKLVEAQRLAALQQDEEDQARHIASTLIESNSKADKGPLVAGTLAETMAATSRWRNEPSNEEREKLMRDLALARHASLVKFLGKKLALANEKVKKAEKALEKVQEYLEPADLPTDLETLTDEERFLFRKIGLSMKPYLLLGRRGIFDGTVENMHLHWKYRELVKIIVDGKRFSLVKHVAISLEAESGGVLVSVDKTTKGYAIIVYRGKNYQRPCAFRPKNLLTRRQALARSIELQRREGLKHHISELQERIEKLKSELEVMKTVKEIDEETLYSRVDNASDNDDDYDDEDKDNMEEDEDEEAYLEIYDSDNEDGDRVQLKGRSI